MPKKKEIEIDFSELKELIDKLPEMVGKKNDEKEEWSLKITRVDNGYKLSGKGGESFEIVIEESETDELKSHEQLLWEIIGYFNFGGCKHDKERIKVVREKQK